MITFEALSKLDGPDALKFAKALDEEMQRELEQILKHDPNWKTIKEAAAAKLPSSIIPLLESVFKVGFQSSSTVFPLCVAKVAQNFSEDSSGNV